MALSKIPNYLQDLIDSDAIGLSAISAAKIGSLPSGSVIQVVSATKTDTTSTTSTSFVDITGLSVTITPSNASNKILLTASLTNGNSSTATTAFRFVQDGAPVVVGDATGSRIQGTTSNGDNSTYHCHSSSMQGEITANTTNATTFKVQYSAQSGGYTSSINRNTYFVNDTENYNGVFTSTLTVMEIAG